MFNKQSLVRSIVNIVKSIGKPYVLTKTTVAYDPSTGGTTEVTTTETYNGMVFNYTTKGSGDGVVYNKLIEQGDRRLFLLPNASNVVPDVVEWTVQIDGAEWRVVSAETIKPADQVFLIECQVRKR